MFVFASMPILSLPGMFRLQVSMIHLKFQDTARCPPSIQLIHHPRIHIPAPTISLLIAKIPGSLPLFAPLLRQCFMFPFPAASPTAFHQAIPSRTVF